MLALQARQIALLECCAISVKELSYKDSILYRKIEGWILEAALKGGFVISFPRELEHEIPLAIVEILNLLGYSIHTTQNKFVIKW